MWEQREDDDSIWFALPFDALEQPVGRRSLGIFLSYTAMVQRSLAKLSLPTTT